MVLRLKFAYSFRHIDSMCPTHELASEQADFPIFNILLNISGQTIHIYSHLNAATNGEIDNIIYIFRK